jgi:hypothetical protein
MELPPANRQRLLWILSQMLERQMTTMLRHGEVGDECDPVR